MIEFTLHRSSGKDSTPVNKGDVLSSSETNLGYDFVVTGWQSSGQMSVTGHAVGSTKEETYGAKNIGLHWRNNFYNLSSPEYSVDGTVYSRYTNLPARAMTLEEAATMAGVSVRTLSKWLKKPLAPRQMMWTATQIVLFDHEVQYWLDNVVNKRYAKRSWKNAFAKLRGMKLVDGSILLKRLQALIDHEWTPTQRRFSKFNDTHVAAYRRGVKDAMDAVRRGGVEFFDYVPKLGQKVMTSGCMGTVVQITDTHVKVSGVYVYSSGTDNDPGHAEAWSEYYDLAQINETSVRPLWSYHGVPKEGNIIWDFQMLKSTRFSPTSVNKQKESEHA